MRRHVVLSLGEFLRPEGNRRIRLGVLAFLVLRVIFDEQTVTGGPVTCVCYQDELVARQLVAGGLFRSHAANRI